MPFRGAPRLEPEADPVVAQAALRLWRQAGNQHFWPIAGQSMLPLLRAGDEILVDHRATCLHPGQIIAFVRHGRLIAHRLLRIEGPILLTKGDNCPAYDPPVSTAAVMGRVIAVRRGQRLRRLDTPLWRLGGAGLAVMGRLWAALYRGGQRLSAFDPQRRTPGLTRWGHRLIKMPFWLIQQMLSLLIWRGE